MRTALILFLLLDHFSLPAQLTGEVHLNEAGIRFTIPPGWTGQLSGEVFIMGSGTEPGFILMMQHDYTTLDAIRQDAKGGLEDEGISLKLDGPLEPFGKNGIGAEFAGAIQQQPAKAYLLGLLNPHGPGVTIMAATESAKYSSRYKALASAVAQSVRFSQVETPAAVRQWKQELMNKRLAYIYSYSSSTNGYTGLSEREEMWLCAAGYFQYKSSSHDTFDSGGAFGYANAQDKGGGVWDVVADSNGGAVLQLQFKDGTVKKYRIQGVQNGKLYLSDYGYFWSGAGEVCR